MDDEVGSIIRQSREQRRLTQDQFAELVDVDTRTIQRWESGEYTPWPAYANKIMAIAPETTSLTDAIKKNPLISDASGKLVSISHL